MSKMKTKPPSKAKKRPISRRAPESPVPFSLASAGGGQIGLYAPRTSPTSPQPPSRLERYQQRIAAVLDRWIKAKDPRLKGVGAGMTLVTSYKAAVQKCFESNDTDAKCAEDLVAERKAAIKAKKKWWRPRPATEADAKIARKFAKCKVMEMFE
jgi:hypothetical protein